jgi:hypothetical protein
MIVRLSLEESTIYMITGEYVFEEELSRHIQTVKMVLGHGKLTAPMPELLNVMDAIFLRNNKTGSKLALDPPDTTALSIYVSLAKNLSERELPDLSYYPVNYRKLLLKHWGAKEFIKSLIDTGYMETFYRILATPIPMNHEGYILTGIFNNIVSVARIEVANKSIAGGRLVIVSDDLPHNVTLQVVYMVQQNKLFWMTMRTLILRMRMCEFDNIYGMLWWFRVDFAWSLLENTLAGDLYTLKVDRSVMILDTTIWNQMQVLWETLTGGSMSLEFGDNPAHFTGESEVFAAYSSPQMMQESEAGIPVVNDHEPEYVDF